MRNIGPIILESNQKAYVLSLARHALATVFSASHAAPGQKILLPAFICCDLLAPVMKAGLVPLWYAINEDLEPEISSSIWPSADYVLAINYFGFPQNLTPFRAYAERVGATLIEDNAHGFLSKDIDGSWLGTRAFYGLFSIRKTLRMPDGAVI